jgi:hypothetical protein
LVKEISPTTVARKPGHRGERGISRKTIARGMPDVSGVTVVTNACAYLTAHAAADAPSVRHSLRPLFFEGTSTQQLGRIAPREGGGVAEIGATSLRGAKRRSNPVFLAAPWIASRSLSSGAHSRDPLARNDGAGLFEN